LYTSYLFFAQVPRYSSLLEAEFSARAAADLMMMYTLTDDFA
jgi:hypothetical protein